MASPGRYPMSSISVERHGAVGVLTINRPERFNAMDVEMARDFRKAGLQLARETTVRCAVIKGVGKAFCTGADLKYIRSRVVDADSSYLKPDGTADAPSLGEGFKEILEYFHSTISEIRRAQKPFIAAVNGVAAAGGFGIAMCCDLVVAREDAIFEWAYHKTGLTGAESSTFFLPKLVGLRKALGLVMLNPRLTAAEALDAGLITSVFSIDEFDEQVMALAQRLAAGPTVAYGITKSLMNQAAGIDQLDYHLDQELQHLARIADGADFAEGLDAFFGKRPPVFAGEG